MNCQILETAWIFEASATCGPLSEYHWRASAAEALWGTHFDTGPNMAYCDTTSQGVSVKLITNTGWNASSDEAAERQVDP